MELGSSDGVRDSEDFLVWGGARWFGLPGGKIDYCALM